MHCESNRSLQPGLRNGYKSEGAQKEDGTMRELTEYEEQLMELIWQKEPLPSGALVELCSERFCWKKSTTYTMLRRLEQKGMTERKQAVVTSCVSREEYRSGKSRAFVQKNFGGSLPGFLTAFAGGKKLSREEARELMEFIESADLSETWEDEE